MRFSESLKTATKQSWAYSMNHPFVQGIIKGDLPLETFKNYIMQDIYYLKHYGKVHAFAAAHADDFSQAALLAEKAQNTAESELTVHKIELHCPAAWRKSLRRCFHATGYMPILAWKIEMPNLE